MKTILSLIFCLLAMSAFVSLILMKLLPNDKYCKQYVLKHKGEICKEDKTLVIPTVENKYYDDITLRLLGEDRYQIIFWGNRDSWKWRFKLDKCVIVDYTYEYAKGRKGTKIDYEILQLIKSFR